MRINSSVVLESRTLLGISCIPAARLPVGHRVGVPALQGVSCSFQSVQLVEQQHVESHQHHQTGGQRDGEVKHTGPDRTAHSQKTKQDGDQSEQDGEETETVETRLENTTHS